MRPQLVSTVNPVQDSNWAVFWNHKHPKAFIVRHINNFIANNDR